DQTEPPGDALLGMTQIKLESGHVRLIADQSFIKGASPLKRAIGIVHLVELDRHVATVGESSSQQIAQLEVFGVQSGELVEDHQALVVRRGSSGRPSLEMLENPERQEGLGQPPPC